MSTICNKKPKKTKNYDVEISSILTVCIRTRVGTLIVATIYLHTMYEGWNFNSGNYLFTHNVRGLEL